MTNSPLILSKISLTVPWEGFLGREIYSNVIVCASKWKSGIRINSWKIWAWVLCPKKHKRYSTDLLSDWLLSPNVHNHKTILPLWCPGFFILYLQVTATIPSSHTRSYYTHSRRRRELVKPLKTIFCLICPLYHYFLLFHVLNAICFLNKNE